MTKEQLRQEVAADILTKFTFVNNMNDVMDVWDKVFKDYNLERDPFTHLPCSTVEYYNNKLEYNRQTMIDRYGHCDGLE